MFNAPFWFMSVFFDEIIIKKKSYINSLKAREDGKVWLSRCRGSLLLYKKCFITGAFGADLISLKFFTHIN